MCSREQRSLELHFALPRTIFTTHVVPGKDEEGRLTTFLHHVLAERAWGCVSDTGDWVWDGEAPSLNCMDETAVSYMQVLSSISSVIHRLACGTILPPPEPWRRTMPYCTLCRSEAAALLQAALCNAATATQHGN